MKKIFVMIMLLSLFWGCTMRIPSYSPRRNDTEAHRQASSKKECLDCHDVKEKKDHNEEEDNCFKCHKLL